MRWTAERRQRTASISVAPAVYVSTQRARLRNRALVFFRVVDGRPRPVDATEGPRGAGKVLVRILRGATGGWRSYAMVAMCVVSGRRRRWGAHRSVNKDRNGRDRPQGVKRLGHRAEGRRRDRAPPGVRPVRVHAADGTSRLPARTLELAGAMMRSKRLGDDLVNRRTLAARSAVTAPAWPQSTQQGPGDRPCEQTTSGRTTISTSGSQMKVREEFYRIEAIGGRPCPQLFMSGHVSRRSNTQASKFERDAEYQHSPSRASGACCRTRAALGDVAYAPRNRRGVVE